ncbi:hypothetical protein BPUTSESOX_288 [uncultured Gammaproteobacteria bacterium]|nr:hypothetical protein [uncultured Gammaproteobacteria bacterium]CAC9655990.1 hypothetical protein [uncultured Gammaproteobacteria bacterium]VVH51529.1 hypothetical protein BPUTSESOX_288 [uncultured Gammaproteobacteria bacterium]
MSLSLSTTLFRLANILKIKQKDSAPSYHNNRVNHQHQKPFLITLSNGDWIRR